MLLRVTYTGRAHDDRPSRVCWRTFAGLRRPSGLSLDNASIKLSQVGLTGLSRTDVGTLHLNFAP